jgi:hypothetical protein
LTEAELNTPNEIMTPSEAARALGLSIFTLNKWRSQKIGPAYIKLGGAVRYRSSDLLTFLEESRVAPLDAA